MDADDRDEILEMIRRELYVLFFGTSSGGVTNGEQNGTGRAGEVLTGVPVLQHYGLASQPPTGTERLYAETQAGLVSIAERSTPPSLTAGQVALYDANGGIVKLLNASGGSRRVEIGKGGSVKDAARKGDAVTAGSTPATGMAAWLAAVTAAMKTTPVTPLPALVAPTDFGTITGGSATVGIED